MKKLTITTLGLLSGLAVSSSAFAHPGHSTTASFAEGFLHPLTGLDHLAALILMGVFAATCTKQVATKLVAFVCGALLAGFMIGVEWVHASDAETLVMASLFVLPVSLLAYRFTGAVKMLAMIAMGGFSVCHGLVQGAEAQGALFQYGFGTMVASLSVIVLSLLITKLVEATARSMRVA
ncbi:HupE/UreJ protein [Vibrio albus]|uniref:HupE/UreJ protein n=1 Tax=Vibrio albus TaxID=2200953 RepID=A0A2U3B960_9VIBR|nr:HupE/UreJ family protein [Vibrio albus]PWI33330.1 HupE/UreJ protein [Vibrio albus]